MKNIAVYSVLVIMLNCTPFAFAQEGTPNDGDSNPYTFSISASFGISLGQAEEIVYPPPEYKAQKLSQLLWDIKPVIYNSLTLDLSRAQPMEKWGLISALSLKIGYPGKSGKMEDRDWDSIENDALTKYSVHDNVTNEFIFIDTLAGISLPIKQKLLLKTYLSLSYMRFSFSGQYGEGTYARGGYGTYASIDDNPQYISYSDWGKVINYSQNWLTAAHGVSLSAFFNRFYGELFFSLGQVIFCIARDEHLTTNTVYKDYMYGGVFIEPGFRFSFIASKRLEFSQDFSWRYLGGIKGESWKGIIGIEDMIQNGNSGAGLSLFNIGLNMKISLRH